MAAPNPSNQASEILADQLGLARGPRGGNKHGKALGINRTPRSQPHQLPIPGDLDARTGESRHGTAQQHQLNTNPLSRDQSRQQCRNRAGGYGNAAAQWQFGSQLFRQSVNAGPIVCLSPFDHLEGRVDPSRHYHKKPLPPPQTQASPIFKASSAGTGCAPLALNSTSSSSQSAGNHWPARRRHSGWRRAD